MASKHKYQYSDDEGEVDRPGLIGLLKVHPPISPKQNIHTITHRRLINSCNLEPRPQTLPHSPLQTRSTRLPHHIPHNQHGHPALRNRRHGLYPLLLELHTSHRLRKRHPPTMGRPTSATWSGRYCQQECHHLNQSLPPRHSRPARRPNQRTTLRHQTRALPPTHTRQSRRGEFHARRLPPHRRLTPLQSPHQPPDNRQRRPHSAHARLRRSHTRALPPPCDTALPLPAPRARAPNGAPPLVPPRAFV